MTFQELLKQNPDMKHMLNPEVKRIITWMVENAPDEPNATFLAEEAFFYCPYSDQSELQDGEGDTWDAAYIVATWNTNA